MLLTTGFFYHRGWELFESAPKVGAPIIKTGDVVSLFSNLHQGVTVDESGRLWRVEWKEYWRRPGTAVPPKFTRIGTDSDWRKLLESRSFSSRHAALLKQDGTLWTFVGPGKSNPNSRLRHQFFDKLQEATPGFRWRDIARSTDHWIGVLEDGTLWTWGLNTRGGFGLADLELSKIEPARVGDDDDWIQVAIESGAENVALKVDGSVWEWGTIRQRRSPHRKEKIPTPRRMETVQSFQVRNIHLRNRDLHFELEDGRIMIRSRHRRDYTKPVPGHPEIQEFKYIVSASAIATGYPTMLVDAKRRLWEFAHPNRTPFGRRGRLVDRDTSWVIATEIDYSEWIGLKHDGSLWYWHNLNQWMSRDETFEGRYIGSPSERLIPMRFRPVKIGMLDERVLATEKEKGEQ